MVAVDIAPPSRFAAIFERYFGQIHQYLARRVMTGGIFTPVPEAGPRPLLPRPGRL
jgi:hypothetical protein